jgi:hypothetical protein
LVRVVGVADSQTFIDVDIGKPSAPEIEGSRPFFQDVGSQIRIVCKHQIAGKEVIKDTGFSGIEADGYRYHDHVLGIRVIGKDFIVNELGYDTVALTHANDLPLQLAIVPVHPDFEF